MNFCFAGGKLTCPACSDRLVHQHRRGIHESTSRFGQFVHDNVARTFDLFDVDEVWNYGKKSRSVVRQIEIKREGQQLRASQERWIRQMDTAIRGIKGVNPGSGYYIVTHDDAMTRFTVERAADGAMQQWSAHEIAHWLEL